MQLNMEKPRSGGSSDVAYDRALWSVFSATLVICSPYRLEKSVGCLEMLQNLPSCDGGTDRLFCVPKGIFRVL